MNTAPRGWSEEQKPSFTQGESISILVKKAMLFSCSFWEYYRKSLFTIPTFVHVILDIIGNRSLVVSHRGDSSKRIFQNRTHAIYMYDCPAPPNSFHSKGQQNELLRNPSSGVVTLLALGTGRP